MGIDLYDALSGIGAGLTSLGQSKETRRKEELAKQLELDREKRANERQLAAEKREEQRRAKVVKEHRRKFVEGVMYVEDINENGDAVRPARLADQSEIEEYQLDQKKNKLGIDALVSQIGATDANAAQTRAETAYLPNKYSLDAELTRSNIEENKAQADAARALATDRERGDPKDRIDTSLGGLTERLLDQSEDLMEQYKEDIPATEFRRLAAAAIKEAASKKVDVRITFPYVLEAYIRKRNAK